MKNLLIDCQTLHTPDRYRGIGRYLLSVLPPLMTDASELRVMGCMTRRPHQWKMPSVMADSAMWRVLDLGNQGVPIPQQELLYRNALEDLIATEGIDVYWNPNCLMPNVLFPGTLRGCLNVATIHDVIPLVMPDPYLTASPADQFEDYIARLLALERYDAIVTPSQCSLQDLLDHTRIEPDRVHVIPDGVSDRFFHSLPSDELDEIRHRYGLSTSVVFSLVGGDIRKNTDRLLESFQQLTRQGDAPDQLVVGGTFDPAERQRLAIWLRENRLEDRVVFTGSVPDEDLAGLYRLSRLFVFPSLYEGFGLPVLEAMASGSPVVTSKSASLPEVAGPAAAYFDPEDCADMSAVIGKVLASDRRRAEMIREGLRRADRFRWQATAAATLDVITEVTSKAAWAPNLQKVCSPPQPLPSRPRKPRWAFFTPLSPQQSGIADYCEELLPHIAAEADIDLFVDGPHPSAPHITENHNCFNHSHFHRLHAQRTYRNVIYQMGNNALHRYIYEMLLSVPGITVLHDYNLHSFIHTITRVNGHAHDPAPERYRQEIDACYGKLGSVLSTRLAQTPPDPRDLWRFHGRFALNHRIVTVSQALVVHSQWVRDQIDRDEVHVIPLGVTLPAPIPPDQLLALRRQNHIPEDAFLVACFGDVTNTKRIATVVRAFSVFRLFHPNSRLWFIGGCEEGMQAEIEDLAHRYRINANIGLTGRVSDRTFMAFMQATDVVLNLRFPTQGETSSSLLKAMACEKPVIVSDINQFRELPDDCVLKAVLGRREQETIVGHLMRLITDVAFRNRIARNARDHVAQHCAWDRVVEKYVEITECYATD
jgi:glycosyltransferase involved in cell wall biosynthesis